MKTISSRIMISFIMGFSLSAGAAIAVHEEKLPAKSEKESLIIANLKQQKASEIKAEWTKCASLAEKNFEKNTNLRGWILLSWVRCGEQELLTEKNEKPLTLALRALEKHQELLAKGPWREKLDAAFIKARLTLIEALATRKKMQAWSEIDSYLKNVESLDKKQRARLFFLLGDLASTQTTELKASLQFLRQSFEDNGLRGTQEKIKTVEFAIEKNLKTGAIIDEEPVKEEKGERSEIDLQFEDRVKSLIRSKQGLAAIEECIRYLNQYPGGGRSKWAQDKVLEQYQVFVDQNAPVDKVLEAILKGDPVRLGEWARVLHKKNDYIGSLALADKALAFYRVSKDSGVLLYIAGRSAQFTGDYARAKDYFIRYIDAFPGSEDYPEVTFRLGLVNMRLNEPGSAVANFEKLISAVQGGKYDLSARYWMTRALQLQKNPRAEVEITDILNKYPLSYYGLKLSMERNEGVLSWPFDEKERKSLKSNWYLLPSQKQSLDKVRLLAANEWTSEAQAEFDEIPLPKDAHLKFLLAQEFSQTGLHFVAIRLANEAFEQQPDLKSLDLIKTGLPLVFKTQIEEQARAQKLSPLLVRSLIRQESAFNTRAMSTSNALGLMQLIPPTAEEVAGELGLQAFQGAEDLFRPDINIQMGAYYLSKMVRQFNNSVPFALAAYNAGPFKVNRFIQSRKEIADLLTKSDWEDRDELWMDEIPWSETSFYVKAILRNTLMYRLLEKSPLDQRRGDLPKTLWKDLVFVGTTAKRN